MTKLNKLFIGSIGVAVMLVLVVALIDPLVSDVTLLPDTGASHYYWQLPVRNSLNMLIVWLLFGLQFIGNVILIRKRQREDTREFTSGNIHLLLFNLLFIGLHFIQSIIGYDGLAQDVPVFSSQYSVILVLVVIILMQIPRRGIIFGKKLKLDKSAMSLLYAIHGFIFTFSIVYTFWFHPTVNTIGHLFGFFYMFLLFIQVGFLKTKIHTNPKWIVCLEVLVAFHGASVAYFVQSSTIWAMFLFGFGFIFFATQIYGLTKNKLVIHLAQLSFIIVVIGYYGITGITNIHQVLWIPIIEYGHVIILYLIIIIVQYFRHKKAQT